MGFLTFRALPSGNRVLISDPFLSCCFEKLSFSRSSRGFFLPESCTPAAEIFHSAKVPTLLAFAF